jgi:membrane peptidoglycan carboxypeptidase
MTKGYRIYTTLDSVLNTQAQAAVLKGVTQISKDTPLQGALVSVENSTGFIRSLIGGKNYSESNFNRILNMRRQVGSTFKPIIWLTAYRLEDSARQLPYSPQTYVYDGPFKLIYDRGKQSWSPKNYEKTHLGWVTMNQALAHSINTVTARLTEELGIDNIIATARSLGIQSDIPRVPSLGLGSLELSPMELTSVYLNFAQETHRKIPMSVRAITDREGHTIDRYLIREEEILIPPAAIRSLVTSMEAVFTEGTAQSAKRLGWNYPSAGKTGTTSQSNDAWFAGFTSEMTTVVWVGPDKNLNNKKLKITGAQAALPIWVETMKAAAQSPTELIPTTADTSSTTTPLSAPTTSPSTTLQSTSYD